MRLSILNERLIVSFRLIVEGTGPAWPTTWSDMFFVPQKSFVSRRMARRFLKWLISLGVPASFWLDAMENGSLVKPPEHRDGRVGRAYMIGDKVVKFTTDRNEASATAALVGKDVPNMARYYAVASVSNPLADKTLYVLVMDRIADKLPGKYRIAANALYTYLDHHPDAQESSLEEIVTGTIALLPRKHVADQGVISGVKAIAKAVLGIHKNAGVMLFDPHPGNVMMRGRDVEMFDLGRSHSKQPGAVSNLEL